MHEKRISNWRLMRPPAYAYNTLMHTQHLKYEIEVDTQRNIYAHVMLFVYKGFEWFCISQVIFLFQMRYYFSLWAV